MDNKHTTFTGIIAAVWGIFGLLALLAFACWRLSANITESFSMPLNWMHWLVLIVFTLFMAHEEGYNGFQKKFSPRFAARAKYLLHNTTLLQLIFAPLFCMAYFHAPKRRVIATCSLTAMIIVFIFTFRYIPQPWKGLLDFGVVLGLVWGFVSTVFYCFKAFTDNTFSWDNEVLIAS